ncbi:Thiamine biosynthesis lipoprotein ApbE precursor [Rubripirellula lacrimiformis]|uniref:FAD:protein FMN transferase n=1 Tax=Rubripirellula lacrimiformis TaxID=1930273 RepID=A0A517NAB3_9BACT|nr:FAD:protein FMN transferase [Rubripirellula lacrimiformis]QDT04072.1 Thiamine biosynthesis lipoprotein ApbE precursor [Rubripirellula lacrimiformis]
MSSVPPDRSEPDAKGPDGPESGWKNPKKFTAESSQSSSSTWSEPGDIDSDSLRRTTPPRESLITHVTHRAMATDFVVMLPEHAADSVEVALEALEMLDQIEAALTIYRPQSEISRVNAAAGGDPVRLSRTTFDLMDRSVLWSRRTEGAFDVTAGPLVDAWGFTRRSGRKPTSDQIHAARQNVGFEKIQFAPDDRTVRLEKQGMSINLGAIGKGHALDRMAARLKGAGVHDFLIHGGNSSLIASGDQDLGDGRGWAVGIAHPTKPPRRLAGLWLRNMALATSGSGKQFFHHQGRRYGHVIDPRTGYPAGDLLALTVLMPSATDADAAATGMFVAGSPWIRQQLGGDDLPDWIECPMLLAAAGARQDEVVAESLGSFDWINPPEPPRTP